MVEANAQKLYKHYTEKGMKKEAEELLSKYPHFKKPISQDPPKGGAEKSLNKKSK